MAEERARNVHVHDGVGEEAFVVLRQARDATLAAPILILPALQVNIRAGVLPEPTAAGNVFLKLPVTGLAVMAAEDPKGCCGALGLLTGSLAPRQAS